MPPTGQNVFMFYKTMTHHNLVAVVGNLVDLGIVAVVGSPAAAVGLAGMVPVVGHTVHYLQKVSAGIVNMLGTIGNAETSVLILKVFNVK